MSVYPFISTVWPINTIYSIQRVLKIGSCLKSFQNLMHLMECIA